MDLPQEKVSQLEELIARITALLEKREGVGVDSSQEIVVPEPSMEGVQMGAYLLSVLVSGEFRPRIVELFREPNRYFQSRQSLRYKPRSKEQERAVEAISAYRDYCREWFEANELVEQLLKLSDSSDVYVALQEAYAHIQSSLYKGIDGAIQDIKQDMDLRRVEFLLYEFIVQTAIWYDEDPDKQAFMKYLESELSS